MGDFYEENRARLAAEDARRQEQFRQQRERDDARRRDDDRKAAEHRSVMAGMMGHPPTTVWGSLDSNYRVGANLARRNPDTGKSWNEQPEASPVNTNDAKPSLSSYSTIDCDTNSSDVRKVGQSLTSEKNDSEFSSLSGGLLASIVIFGGSGISIYYSVQNLDTPYNVLGIWGGMLLSTVSGIALYFAIDSSNSKPDIKPSSKPSPEEKDTQIIEGELEKIGSPKLNEAHLKKEFNASPIVDVPKSSKKGWLVGAFLTAVAGIGGVLAIDSGFIRYEDRTATQPSPQPFVPSSPTPRVTTLPPYTHAVTAERLKMRMGPGTEFRTHSSSQFTKNECIRGVGRAVDGWQKVAVEYVGGGIGEYYVSTDHIRTLAPNSPCLRAN